MPKVSDLSAATALTDDDTLYILDGATSKKITAAAARPYFQVDTVQDHGSMGATETFDVGTAAWHRGVLDANVTLTFTGAVTGSAYSFTVELAQDATGGRTVTVPGSVKWIGALPTWGTTASKIAGVASFTSRDGGATWLGFFAGAEL